MFGRRLAQSRRLQRLRGTSRRSRFLADRLRTSAQRTTRRLPRHRRPHARTEVRRRMDPRRPQRHHPRNTRSDRHRTRRIQDRWRRSPLLLPRRRRPHPRDLLVGQRLAQPRRLQRLRGTSRRSRFLADRLRTSAQRTTRRLPRHRRPHARTGGTPADGSTPTSAPSPTQHPQRPAPHSSDTRSVAAIPATTSSTPAATSKRSPGGPTPGTATTSPTTAGHLPPLPVPR